MDALFGTKPLQLIGDWSFSIYLVHQPLLYTIGSVFAYLNPPQKDGSPASPPPQFDIFTAWLICLVFIAITLVISYLTYRFVEVPARKKINQQFGDVKVSLV